MADISITSTVVNSTPTIKTSSQSCGKVQERYEMNYSVGLRHHRQPNHYSTKAVLSIIYESSFSNSSTVFKTVLSTALNCKKKRRKKRREINKLPIQHSINQQFQLRIENYSMNLQYFSNHFLFVS